MKKEKPQHFVPYEKLSKKEQRKLNARKRANSFGMSMVTKVTDDKKYNRAKQRRDGKKEARHYGHDS